MIMQFGLINTMKNLFNFLANKCVVIILQRHFYYKEKGTTIWENFKELKLLELLNKRSTRVWSILVRW